MKMIGAPHGLQDGLIHPLTKYPFIYLFTSADSSCRHLILTSVVRLGILEKFNVMHSISIHRHTLWIKDIIEFLDQKIPS